MVTGWGYLDVLLVAARVHSAADARGVSFALVDTARAGLHARPRRLAALNATRTVHLDFDRVEVGDEDVVQTSALPARAAEGEGVRDHAQRLAREAIFLLAFGQRPAIKRALLEGLA